MRLVEILVDKVLVSYDEEGIKEVEVMFRFNVENDDNDNSDLEPTKGLNKKNANNDVSFCEYGRYQGKPYIYISILWMLHKYREWRVWRSEVKIIKNPSIYFKEEKQSKYIY